MSPSSQRHPSAPVDGHGAPPTPAWPERRPARTVGPAARHGRAWSGVGTVAAFVLCSVVLVLVGVWLAGRLGPETLFVVGLLALVPLGICAAGLWWVDRWDPEPKSALGLAVVWGAGASVVLTLLVAEAVTMPLAVLAPAADAELLGAVVQAPLVEELAKGLGVLLVFLVAWSHFDGPIDGIVYGGAVGAGFAFTENILYFSGAVAESGSEALSVFVMRGLLSPFAHVLFTAWTGFALGLAASRGARGRWPLYFLLGLVPAIAGHFLWNGGLALLFQDFWSFYVMLQMPLFACAVAAVWMLRRAERRLTERRLGDYRDAGWFTDEEVEMLATGPGRRAAAAWARRYGAGGLMRDFAGSAARLAAVRHRILRGHGVDAARAEETRLLSLALRQRQQLLAQVGAPRSGGA
ncbi:MAG: PrsW family intramembrane metalloprotease [Arthrobacter sp.]|uniref:PrsW family intramembrane metalloprotease n=1 Tax=Arthrobacter sp. TaxID=1667 RepID=UPI0034760D0F